MRELIKYVLIPAIVGAAVGLGYMLVSLLISGAVVEPEPAPVQKPGYASAVRKAGPAVVNIYSTKVVRTICQEPRFRELCNRFTGASRSQMQSALGSGVVVHADGYILTNYHVIHDADRILVAFENGQTTTAELIGNDPETDLAVIRVPLSDLTPITLGSSNAIEVGDVALAIGNPFGIGQTVSAGIISAKGRTGISASPYDDFIQTDAAINPGNSGGALIDAQGRLIGINTLIFSRSGNSAGVGFAIPAQLAFSVLEEIIATGRVTRGWLGVVLENAPQPGRGVGLQITAVEPGGPADIAGLLSGDLILSINERPAVSSAIVSREIAHTEPGEIIELGMLRMGRQFSITAISGERPPPNSP